MITQLTDMIKINMYRIFLWIFLGVLVFGGMSFDFMQDQSWVVKIDKQTLTDIEYRQAVKNSQYQYDSLKAQGISWPRTESLEKEVLRHMVTNLLMKNLAKKSKIYVPLHMLEEKLEEQLSHLPDYFFDAQGQLRVDMLEKLIAPQSIASLLQSIEDEIASNLLFNLASIGSYISQFEVSGKLVEDYADKNYSVLKFSLKKALEKVKENTVSDDILERFYKKSEHGDLYKTAEKRSGCFWTFNHKDYGLTVSKKEALAYYDQHKHDYLESPAQVQVHRIFFAQDDSYNAKEQAQIVHDELVAHPETFASVAKKIAAFKLSYQGSEKTEYFAKDSTKYDSVLIHESFEQLAEDLAISSVIKTKQGYEILQRIGRKPAKYKSFEEVSHELEEKLLEDKFAKRFKQDAQRVVGNARYNKENVQVFADKRNGRKEILNMQERKMTAISMQLFQTDVQDYAIFMDGKEGILLECTGIEKKSLKSFNSVKESVKEHYYKKQAEEELKNMAADACKHLKVEDFEVFAKTYDATFEKVHSTYKNDQMDYSALLRKPEISEKVKILHNKGDIIDIATSTESYVIRLDDVKPLEQEIIDSKKMMVQSTMYNKAKYEYRNSFIDSLYRHDKLNDKIEIKEQFLKEIKDLAL